MSGMDTTLLLLLLISTLCLNICSANYAMNHTCSPPAAQGGKGYCGPSYCDLASSAATLYGCNFTSMVYNYPNMVAGTNARTCTQSTDPRCSSASLAALMHGPGIKAAYCNDLYLVLQTDLTPGFPTYLGQIRNPPAAASDSNGKRCVTRYVNPSFQVIKIPLYPVMLSTADRNINNINTLAFPGGGGDYPAAYMIVPAAGGGGTYGLPTRGGVGVTIAGQVMYPAFNNVAYLAPQKCEVDTCNQHVGGGGGQPHLHGDPFGSWCLYSQLNYSSIFVHPPQIGWSFDGYNIFGRHLSTSNLGYSTSLDDCGGHVHDSLVYHYHSQVLSATTDAGAIGPKGQSYYASIGGPYKCFRGDISQISNYWGIQANSNIQVTPDTTSYMCQGTTNYYAAYGMTLPNLATSAPSVLPTAVPSPGPPTVAPTPTPTNVPPTYRPTVPVPSVRPSLTPTVSPTFAPPTVVPTFQPSLSPTTATPTATPSVAPTLAPTRASTASPSLTPTTAPTVTPTTAAPTLTPTTATPTTATPTATPTSAMPSNIPSATPTAIPTTATPSFTPTQSPTSAGPVTYVVSQTVMGVDISTSSKSTLLVNVWTAAIAAACSVSVSAVSVTGMVKTGKRRLGDIIPEYGVDSAANIDESASNNVELASNNVELASNSVDLRTIESLQNRLYRPFLQDVITIDGVVITYTIATAAGSSSSSISSAITAHTTKITSSLVNNGFSDASVSSPSAIEVTTSSSKSSSTSGTYKMQSSYIMSVSLIILVTALTL